VGYRPYADVTEAALSTPPPRGEAWTDETVEGIAGAKLNQMNLRFARGYKVFLINAKLWRAIWTEFISPKLTCEERICEKRFYVRQFSIAPSWPMPFLYPPKRLEQIFRQPTCASWIFLTVRLKTLGVPQIDCNSDAPEILAFESTAFSNVP